MADKISRRDFASRAAVVAAGIAAAPLLRAQDKAPDKPLVTDAEMEAVQQKLAKPLNEDEKKILRDDLVNQKNDTKKRLDYKLPENSEPCFVYNATPYKKVSE